MCDDVSNYEKRGYLHEEFRLFHLKDSAMDRIDWHFHEFHKIILFLSGQVGYCVEGKHYSLLPGDLILVPRGCIHRPEIQAELPYERMVLYISEDILRRLSSEGCELSQCFAKIRQQYSYVLRPNNRFDAYVGLFSSLEEAVKDRDFGAELLRRSIFAQLLVRVNRDIEKGKLLYVEAASCDEKIVAILQYLNVHLAQPLSIDRLSQQFYLSKYHMMRRFRMETGCTIHSYLTEKRLQLAKQRLLSGEPAQSVCTACGFQDYSAFSRAFKKRYGISPGAARNRLGPEEPIISSMEVSL